MQREREKDFFCTPCKFPLLLFALLLLNPGIAATTATTSISQHYLLHKLLSFGHNILVLLVPFRIPLILQDDHNNNNWNILFILFLCFDRLVTISNCSKVAEYFIFVSTGYIFFLLIVTTLYENLSS